MGERLKHWTEFLRRMGPDHADLAHRVLLEEAKAELSEQKRAPDPPVRWTQWVKIPEGSDLHTPLELLCEKQSVVIPIGPPVMHLQSGWPPSREEVLTNGFAVYERGTVPGPLEVHAKTCNCTLRARASSLF